MMCGGWSNTQVNEHHTEVVTNITPGLNAKLNATHTYTIVEVKQQVVAGMNFEFLLATDNNKQVRAKVFKPLPYTNLPPEIKEAAYV